MLAALKATWRVLHCIHRLALTGPRWLIWLLAGCLWAAAAPRGLAAETPTLTITVASAFLRAAPSTQAPATYSVFQGDVFPVTGRTADNAWLQVAYPKATRGTWIRATLGQLTGSLADVPIVEPAGLTATPASPLATGPAEPPPTLSPTPASTTPSTICVLLYNDANGNGQVDPAEGAIDGGQVTLQAADTGVILQTFAIGPGDTGRHCFTDLPAGFYTISAAAPLGYNATTATSLPLRVQPAERHALTFGAQPGVGAAPAAGPTWFSSAGLWVGLGLLLLAAGLLVFGLSRRR